MSSPPLLLLLFASSFLAVHVPTHLLDMPRRPGRAGGSHDDHNDDDDYGVRLVLAIANPLSACLLPPSFPLQRRGPSTHPWSRRRSAAPRPRQQQQHLDRHHRRPPLLGSRRGPLGARASRSAARRVSRVGEMHMQVCPLPRLVMSSLCSNCLRLLRSPCPGPIDRSTHPLNI